MYLLKEFLQTVKKAVEEVIDDNRDDPTLGQMCAAHFKQWAETAEADRKKFECQQHYFQSQQEFEMWNLLLKQFFAYALNCMPTHYDFWGNLSPHSIHLSRNGDICSFRLIHSQDAHAMPVTFHQTVDELQNIVRDIHNRAIHVLREKIQINTDLLVSQFWNAQRYEQCDNTFAELWNNYRVVYADNQCYLFIISALNMTPISDGVKVSFTANYHDDGLSPINYWAYLQAL